MVGDSWDERIKTFWYAEPEIRWVIFGVQSIEQTEEFAIAYATDVANVHGSWLPYGMPELGVCGRKLFIDVAVGSHLQLEGFRNVRRNMVLAPRRGVTTLYLVIIYYSHHECLLFGSGQVLPYSLTPPPR